MGRLVESFKMILALEIALIVMLPKLVKKYKIGEIALYVPKYIRNVFVMFLINCFVSSYYCLRVLDILSVYMSTGIRR